MANTRYKPPSYLYAATGDFIYGAKSRKEIQADFRYLRDTITEFAQAKSGQRLLRIYWYDVTPNRIPTLEHDQVAEQSNMVVRLGRLTDKGRHKGVDAMMCHDLHLMNKSKNVSDVFIISGDEDLLETVSELQSDGIHVSIIAIGSAEKNVAHKLRQSADVVFTFGKEDLIGAFSDADPGQTAQSSASTHRLRELQHQYGESAIPRAGEHERSLLETAASEVAIGFLADASAGELDELEDQLEKPIHDRMVPRKADAWLLSAGGRAIEGTIHPSDKPLLRESFWGHIETNFV